MPRGRQRMRAGDVENVFQCLKGSRRVACWVRRSFSPPYQEPSSSARRRDMIAASHHIDPEQCVNTKIDQVGTEI